MHAKIDKDYKRCIVAIHIEIKEEICLIFCIFIAI